MRLKTIESYVLVIKYSYAIAIGIALCNADVMKFKRYLKYFKAIKTWYKSKNNSYAQKLITYSDLN